MKSTYRILDKGALLLIFFFALSSCTKPQIEKSRSSESFTSQWKFILGDGSFTGTDVDDSGWRILDLPHDWSIEGEFDKDNPATTGGGALPGGIGWYRKHFVLPASDSAKNIFIEFDGIYWNSEVYLNGNLLGKRPNGYISFRYDMSPYLNFGEEENILAVKVANDNQPNSRWYTGSGIYRKVRLIKTNDVYINFWKTFISTPNIEDNLATVRVETELINKVNSNVSLKADMRIIDPEGREAGQKSLDLKLSANSVGEIKERFEIADPDLWTTGDPNLYRLEISLYENDKLIDDETTSFGIRSFRFDPSDGFFLNGEAMKILGVCMHHDLGSLGAAVNRRAIERQLEILKDMGCNAIRTSHNPPAPELLDLCDEMGFLVMDETFDMWRMKKSPYDYSQYWDEWHVKDLQDHILRDRNHPSVIMWSIGNEILEQWDPSGTAMTRELYDIVNGLDDTREIVTGNNEPTPASTLLKADVMNLIGYNYKHRRFEKFPDLFPGKSFIAAESTSGLMTRGHYDMPSDSIRRWPYRWDRPFYDGNADYTVSSYDNVSTPWGSTHEETWALIKKHDYLSGLFIWTGFDYLGEPTPYGWPSRSSYFGIVDLAGFPKDVYYMYKSEWTDDPVLHLLPHWNWTDGEEIDVLAYTNCSSVELFLNGKSMGVQNNSDSIFHLKWKLKYEPGKLLAVGKLASGETLRDSVITAGKPYNIEAFADRSRLKSDGEDLSFITINVLDEAGKIVPYADNLISCRIEGEVKIAGVDNGNQVSHESFKAPYRKAFNGKCLFIIQSGSQDGSASIKFTSEGLEGAELTLNIEK